MEVQTSSELTQPTAAARRVAQSAAVNRDLCAVESSGDQAEDGEGVLPARLTDGLICQNRRAVLQEDAVVLPVASGGQPAEPQCSSIGRHGER